MIYGLVPRNLGSLRILKVRRYSSLTDSCVSIAFYSVYFSENLFQYVPEKNASLAVACLVFSHTDQMQVRLRLI